MMFGGGNIGRGGGGGGGSLLRSVGRAVTRANLTGGTHLQETISPSSSSTSSSGSRHVNNTGSSSSSDTGQNHLYVSSPFASCNVPASAALGVPTWHLRDELDWVSVDGACECDDERATGFVDDFAVGPVPSEDEVHYAVSALQQVFSPDSYSSAVRDKFGPALVIDEEHRVASPTDSTHPSSEIDWIEPSLCMCDPKTLQCHGTERVHDALRLLRTEPLVQKMVKSLSSDEAVWNAVLNNKVVRELRELLSSEDIESDEDSDGETSVVKRVFDGTRAKIMEVVDRIAKLVSELFRFQEGKTMTMGASEAFMEKLKTSFMLSVMVLLVVVVSRAHKA